MNTTQRNLRTRLVGAVLMLGAAMTLSACSTPPTGAALWTQARDAHAVYWSAITDLEKEIYTGDWLTPEYGGAPSECKGGDKYYFRLFHALPINTGIEEDTDALAKRIAAWLKDNGWEKVEMLGYNPPVTSVNVSARKPSANVDDLLVNVQGSDVSIRALSTCTPGDTGELLRLMFPGRAPSIESQNPADPPQFGQLPEPTS